MECLKIITKKPYKIIVFVGQAFLANQNQIDGCCNPNKTLAKINL
jgi:hypothetical protein